jgi:hypothetical protein
MTWVTYVVRLSPSEKANDLTGKTGKVAALVSASAADGI